MSQAAETTSQSSNPLARACLLVGGWLFVGLAMLGAILPLLPATPFLLLASGCFVRSSPRMRLWLSRSPLLGPILCDWQERRGVTRRVKRTAILVVLIGVGSTLLAADLSAAVRVLAVCLAAIGLAVVAKLPTVR